MEKEVGKWFKYQGRVITKAFNKMRRHFVESAESDFNAMFDSAIKVTVLNGEEIFEAGLVNAVSQGYTALQDEIGMQAAFELKQPEAVKWARTQAAVDVSAVNDTTKESIRGMVTRGLEQGSSYDTVARQISKRFEEFAVGKPQAHIQSRAHLVAINENAVGYAHGETTLIDEIEATGIRTEKKWQTVGDNNVSDGCQQNADADWIPYDQAFPSGDQTYPRFPGCRCSNLRRVARGQDDKVASLQDVTSVQDTLTSVGDEIRPLSHERGVVVDSKSGMILRRVNGGKSSVSMGKEIEEGIIRNNIMMHNHPSGTTVAMSQSDVLMITRSGSADSLVITKGTDKIVSASWTGKLPTVSDQKLMMKRVGTTIRANSRKAMRNGTMTPAESSATHWDRFWSMFGSRYERKGFKFNYTVSGG